MGHVKIAVHQPNYLPWLGFFQKISKVESFVLLDNVQFNRRGYSHRVHVLGPGEAMLWLTQSIQKRPVKEYMLDEVTFADLRWKDKHLKTLETAYRRTPHFLEVITLIDQCFQYDTESLALFNANLIQTICRRLGIRARIVYSSQLGLKDFLSASERIACITRHLGGDIYLSGVGARAYNEEGVFARYGVQLEYNRFEEKPYRQRQHSTNFIGGLSIVDALFNLGFEGVAIYLAIGKDESDISSGLPMLEAVCKHCG